MKTAETIEAQQERKKAEKDTLFSTANSSSGSSKRGPGRYGDARQLKPWQFQPGVSGNPSGRPKHDVASEIAQALFTNNPELIKDTKIQ